MNIESSSGQSVSVIIPTMNEELAVRKVVTEIQRELPDAEIIVIDSSSDKTAEIAKTAPGASRCSWLGEWCMLGKKRSLYLSFSTFLIKDGQ